MVDLGRYLVHFFIHRIIRISDSEIRKHVKIRLDQIILTKFINLRGRNTRNEIGI